MRWVEEREEGGKEISLGIILPPRAVTLMMALRVPLGPATLTRPVGKERSTEEVEEEVLSGEEGGVRGCRDEVEEEEEVREEGEEEGEEILTVSWSLRLAMGETWRLLFSTLMEEAKDDGQKGGGQSPSRERMEDVEEEEERRPGEG